jgi:hypothetical protein
VDPLAGFRRVGRGRELPSPTTVRRDRVVRRREDVSGVGVLSGMIGSGSGCGSSTSEGRLGESSIMGEPGGREGDDSLVCRLSMSVSASRGLEVIVGASGS